MGLVVLKINVLLLHLVLSGIVITHTSNINKSAFHADIRKYWNVLVVVCTECVPKLYVHADVYSISYRHLQFFLADIGTLSMWTYTRADIHAKVHNLYADICNISARTSAILPHGCPHHANMHICNNSVRMSADSADVGMDKFSGCL